MFNAVARFKIHVMLECTVVSMIIWLFHKVYKEKVSAKRIDCLDYEFYMHLAQIVGAFKSTLNLNFCLTTFLKIRDIFIIVVNKLTHTMMSNV